MKGRSWNSPFIDKLMEGDFKIAIELTLFAFNIIKNIYVVLDCFLSFL
jgi:hypothetical protein